MQPSPSACRRRWLWLLGLVSLVSLWSWPGHLASQPAQELEVAASVTVVSECAPKSLALIPADAAFYQGLFRCREQVEIVRASRAWAALTKMPALKKAWEDFQKEWNSSEGDLARVRVFLEQKDNQQLLEVLLDMVSHEIFVYGGKSCGEMLALLSSALGSAYFAAIPEMMRGRDDPAATEKAQVRAVLKALNDNADDLVVPDLVIGFRLSGSSEAAAAQIRRLELLGGLLVSFVPELKGALKREKLQGAEFLVFTLDFAKLPLKDLNFKEFEEEPGEFEDLADWIKELKVSVALGIKDDLVLLVLGESAAKTLEAMTKGPRLIEREEVKPALSLLKQRLTSFGYVSKELTSMGTSVADQLASYKETLEEALEESPLSEDQQERLLKDFERMLKDLEPFMPKMGANVGASVLTAGGLEFFSWDYSQYFGRESSQPLTLLDHVGGSPILAYVSRTGGWLESYRNFAKWTRIGYGWFDELFKEHAPDEARVQYERIMKAAVPIFQRFHQTTENKLLPALADGQTAIVLDAKLFSKQWQAMMPESPKPLPLLEPALVCGVADAKLLREAFSDYRACINDLLAKAHELFPDQVPEWSLPEPDTAKVSDGTLYYYPLPSILGLDEQLQPNAGLNERLATLSLSKDHAARLLKKTRLNSQFEPLKAGKACHATFHLNFQELVAGVEPWVDFVITQAPEFQGENQFSAEDRAQIEQILKLARVLGHYESVTWKDKGAWKTHGRWTLFDLDK